MYPRRVHPRSINPVFSWSPRRQQLCDGHPIALLGNGGLFSGPASSLDAFSSYRLERGCPALPFRTTGTLEAPTFRSSRISRAISQCNRALRTPYSQTTDSPSR